MKALILALLSWTALPAAALEPSCESYLSAVERTSTQPQRHSISDLGDGLRSELIVKDGQSFLRLDGRWRKGPADFAQREARLNADIRSGKIRLFACRKLGRELVGGIATTVYAYQLQFPGRAAPQGEALAYIGDDGLVHAQAADGAKVLNRFSGISQPKL